MSNERVLSIIPDFYFDWWNKLMWNYFSFQQKVGLFYDAESLQSKVTARSLPEPSEESYTNVKCYACEMRKVCLSSCTCILVHKVFLHHFILIFIYRNSTTTCISRSIETPCLLFIQTNINIVICFCNKTIIILDRIYWYIDTIQMVWFQHNFIRDAAGPVPIPETVIIIVFWVKIET